MGARKVIISTNVTLNGFMAGSHCELDWHFGYWNEEMAMYTGMQLCRADTILLGRRTFNAMAAYWPGVTASLCAAREEIAFAGMMNSYRKIVFSRSLQTAGWNNAVLASTTVSRTVMQLKALPGKDMIVLGSGSIVSALMQAGLADELALWVHPVLLDQGKRFFPPLQHSFALQLSRVKTFGSGVTLLCYERAPEGI
ncbi:dihydrofolate reductase family protein [Compostibacter hankyongensis]|uniref:Dihydrofolate reductase family protein n=1 Tax=Compostibacter hankyongensis TaxID=1007089 RepID=A0ABP8FMF5_9BACT